MSCSPTSSRGREEHAGPVEENKLAKCAVRRRNLAGQGIKDGWPAAPTNFNQFSKFGCTTPTSFAYSVQHVAELVEPYVRLYRAPAVAHEASD